MESNSIIKRISYMAWVKKFSPIKNPFNSFAGIEGCLFQTYGKEGEFVNNFHNSQIWTLVIMDLARTAAWEISSGTHHVNREGFLITKKPVLPNTTILIHY